MNGDTLMITDRSTIIAQYGKTREDADKDIDLIVEWFKTQKHLPEVMHRNAIERYLVITRFSVERTKQLCDMYYTSRKLIPQVFEKCNPNLPEMNIYFDTVIHVPLPKLTKNLFRVILIKFTDFEHPNYNPNEFVAHIMNAFEIMLLEEMSMGDVIVIDFQKIRMSYVLKSNPVHLKTASFFMEQIWSSRVKGIHFVNVPSFADMLITLLKSVFKKKILERTYLHSSIETLYEHVEKEVLPKDYGGSERSAQELSDLWRKKMLSHQELYHRLSKLEVNEALRPERLENSDILGYYGHFKALSVD